VGRGPGKDSDRLQAAAPKVLAALRVLHGAAAAAAAAGPGAAACPGAQRDLLATLTLLLDFYHAKPSTPAPGRA